MAESRRGCAASDFSGMAVVQGLHYLRRGVCGLYGRDDCLGALVPYSSMVDADKRLGYPTLWTGRPSTPSVGAFRAAF